MDSFGFCMYTHVEEAFSDTKGMTTASPWSLISSLDEFWGCVRDAAKLAGRRWGCGDCYGDGSSATVVELQFRPSFWCNLNGLRKCLKMCGVCIFIHVFVFHMFFFGRGPVRLRAVARQINKSVVFYKFCFLDCGSCGSSRPRGQKKNTKHATQFNNIMQALEAQLPQGKQ